MKAKKVNMTQIFDESGEVFPVTIVVLQNQGEGLDADSQALPLAVGDMITVSGISKGKGFQGVVKRHKFEGGRRSHGQKHSEREAGSIGGGGRAGGRVAKGMRMAGRMGGEKVTIKNLRVIRVEPETREIFIRGAIPGRRGTKVEVRSMK
ncbi:MAG: 50S ribosomal protein L3 [Candidatus Zambryskibacteria bacterium RIFCSPHIGHO2_12_FULL_48_10]|uniref:Large ribosomal subunit protein uL3 n=1 Tax=Candidatus Zambryskibacteria bacterium RIFCSPHIGHO2_01_FULL_46_25 TaxID=1802738 RepID=A0A1G2T0I7_9BACT|nr:MAG: 50S ribosomal protein L3 [Parcubacteria group bacterium GW2011_GWA1_47_10]OHA90131.1 MAG: 50S ribosomal protein L3 [Candidatus Zambryskibacteria bacterium RIFCSPHIGHO2_01_FULL_46_25]OHB01310.1 MAG: 50S ribosomal protein L3 [Candidatus Zambryskibacteria bacterium RIFCSPHIGHO2_12_FULL_48_10]OHB06494.1 MAG: 50S ribosomal protein L3 [Candidatus Zambryskibacteria bacterium RIFCSPLOWO2_01_FULL_48_25]